MLVPAELARQGGLEALRETHIAWLNQLDPLHPSAGGAERTIHEVSKRLASRGHKVTVISERFPGQPEEDSIDGYSIFRPAGRAGVHVWAAINFRMLKKFDIVLQDLSKVLPWSVPQGVGVPSIAIARHLNGGILMSEAPWFTGPLLWIAERLYPRVYRHMPFITESVITRDSLAGIGIPVNDIQLVRPGVDHEKYSPESSVRSPDPVILSVGRLRRYKGVEIALRAFKLVLRRWPKARMIIVGKGEEANSLHALAQRLHLDGHVEFTGAVSEDRLIGLYRNAWLHVQPSRAEGWGYTVLEAAACATPTVAFTGTALSESVGAPCRKYLASRRSPESLAESMSMCLSDMSQNASTLSAALDAYAKEFDWRSTAERYEAIVSDTLERRSDASNIRPLSLSGSLRETIKSSVPKPGQAASEQ